MIKKVKLSKLQGNSFTIVPKPFDDELFSSWFARLAYAHHTHPQTFINLYFGLSNRGLFKNNIDISLDVKLLQQIQTMCNNKIDIFKLTLKTYSGYLQEDDINIPSNRFFSHLKYCPMCLREDNIPYFRKAWKLAFSTICLKHNCFLHASCQKCNAPLSILKMYKDKSPFSSCQKCGFELKKARKIGIRNRYLSARSSQQKILEILHQGYAKFYNNIVYSFFFFDTINQLAKIILLKQNFEFIERHRLFKLLQNCKVKQFNTSKSIYIQLDAKENFALFGLIWHLFEAYPRNLEQFIHANSLTHWDMVKEIRYLSFWYDNLVNNIIPRYIAFGDIITVEEIENGKKYLASQGLEINKANLSRLFGNINYFSKYQDLPPKAINEQI
jgi:Zn ribbon nucleic-acid-binding protein